VTITPVGSDDLEVIPVDGTAPARSPGHTRLVVALAVIAVVGCIGTAVMAAAAGRERSFRRTAESEMRVLRQQPGPPEIPPSIVGTCGIGTVRATGLSDAPYSLFAKADLGGEVRSLLPPEVLVVVGTREAAGFRPSGGVLTLAFRLDPHLAVSTSDQAPARLVAATGERTVAVQIADPCR
jgi:hypothetical protein